MQPQGRLGDITAMLHLTTFYQRRIGAAAALLALTGFTFLAPFARAQQVAVAQLDGYVTDPSGQAIVGALVKVTEVNRDQVRTANTDVTGRYQFPNLLAGSYQLEVNSPGFKSCVQKGIVL